MSNAVDGARPASPYAAPGQLRAPPGVEPPDAITRQDAVALAEAIASGMLSSREVVTAFLDRIERLNPTYNAIVSLRPRADILADADAADARTRAGASLGLLHGLPIAIKDLMPTAGLRTTFGSPLFADSVPAEDGLAAARIRRAGAIIVGKTNTPEFGLGSHTVNPVFGATANAYDPALSAGGSSGGAAVALALRMLPVADGSDMGGSLRNPAGWNNVLGLRPTIGRVPSVAAGDVFTAPLATDGPMARTARDLARLLDVMSGPDDRAPLSLPAPARPFEDIAPAAPGLRIGWLGDLDGHLPMEAGVAEASMAGLARLEKAGYRVEPAQAAFDLDSLWRAFVVLRQNTIATQHRDLLNRADAGAMKPEMRWEIEGGLALSAQAIREALVTRSAWYAEVSRLLRSVSFLALPTACVWPFPITETWPRTIAGRAMDSYHRWMEVVVGGTLAGLPVLALPCGFTRACSSGLQLLAPPRSEDALLSVAQAYEMT